MHKGGKLTLRDWIGLLGYCVLVVGVGLVSIPASLIVAGAAFLATAIWWKE